MLLLIILKNLGRAVVIIARLFRKRGGLELKEDNLQEIKEVARGAKVRGNLRINPYFQTKYKIIKQNQNVLNQSKFPLTLMI